MAVKLKKVKRHLSASAIRSIRKAQKRRWAAFHAEQDKTNGTVKVTQSAKTVMKVLVNRLLSERTKIYNNPMEAYIGGFLDGRSSK
jgi:hypothetical protein